MQLKEQNTIKNEGLNWTQKEHTLLHWSFKKGVPKPGVSGLRGWEVQNLKLRGNQNLYDNGLTNIIHQNFHRRQAVLQCYREIMYFCYSYRHNHRLVQTFKHKEPGQSLLTRNYKISRQREGDTGSSHVPVPAYHILHVQVNCFHP